MKNRFSFFIAVTFALFFSCNSGSVGEKTNTQKAADSDIPLKYLEAAEEFCACHGDWLQIQYDGEVAKKNQDIAKLTELGEKLKALPDRTDCTKALDTKMEQYEREDGPEMMEKYFDAAAKVNCPIFIKILDLAEQVQDVG